MEVSRGVSPNEYNLSAGLGHRSQVAKLHPLHELPLLQFSQEHWNLGSTLMAPLRVDFLFQPS